MAMREHPPMPRSVKSSPARGPQALVAELHTILDHHSRTQLQSLVTDFVVRYRLTHSDVEDLLATLAEVPPSPEAMPPVSEEPTTNGPADERTPALRWSADAVEACQQQESTAGDMATGSDLAWMLGEESEAVVHRPADDLVGRALDDLMGDWTRTGGQLTRADVALMATKRKLSPAEHGELLDLLSEEGVELPASTEPRPTWAARKGHELQADSVGQYLEAIGRYPLINGSREVELWSLISQGVAAQAELDTAGEGEYTPSVRRSLEALAADGRRAHAELVCANLRLVVSIAKARHYDSSGVEFADRIQDGNLGLIRAADKFDGSKGFKFSTYATNWIRQFIERGIADRGRTVRIPVHVHEEVQKVRRAVAKLNARLDRDPTLAEISDRTGLEPGRVQYALDLMRPLRSLDDLLGDEGDLHLSDVLVREEDRDGRADPAEIVVHAMFYKDTKNALRALLPERSACVLERRFGLGTGEKETLENIAADYGITRERIRQIQDKSLKILQESEQASALRSYLVDDSKAI